MMAALISGLHRCQNDLSLTSLGTRNTGITRMMQNTMRSKSARLQFVFDGQRPPKGPYPAVESIYRASSIRPRNQFSRTQAHAQPFSYRPMMLVTWG